MERIALDEPDNRYGPHDVKRPLTKALGLTDMALNYYDLEPGDTMGFGYHSHSDQEEVFVVLSGTVSFETPEGDLEVDADEAVRFGPGESQLGTCVGDERARVLAIGAPQDAGELSLVRECANCGFRTPNTIQLTDDREAIVTVCLECGFETGRWTD